MVDIEKLRALVEEAREAGTACKRLSALRQLDAFVRDGLKPMLAEIESLRRVKAVAGEILACQRASDKHPGDDGQNSYKAERRRLIVVTLTAEFEEPPHASN